MTLGIMLLVVMLGVAFIIVVLSVITLRVIALSFVVPDEIHLDSLLVKWHVDQTTQHLKRWRHAIQHNNTHHNDILQNE
jgi:hypothetical protein